MIYKEFFDTWLEIATLDQESIGNTGPLFDIVDVGFASRLESTYMYLADRINGTHIIDITNINATATSYPYLPNKIEYTGESVLSLDQDQVNLY